MVTRPVIPIIIAGIILGALLIGYILITIKKRASVSDKAFSIARVALLLLLVFLINVRIMDKKYNVNVETKNIDVLFVVDTTISMWAEDYVGKNERMEGVIDTAEHIMEELHGSSFALIRFDNKSQILAPFTQDRKSVEDAFETIKAPDRWYAKGTSLNTAYGDMETLLKSSDSKEGKTTVLFFISDGEITDESELQSFAELEKLVDSGAVLGFGTEKGGKMKLKDDYGSSDYLYDYDAHQDAVSKIDEGNLRQMASDLDIKYIHVENPNVVDNLIKTIKTGTTTSIGRADAVLYDDTYYYYAAPLLALLLLEAFMLVRKGRI